MAWQDIFKKLWPKRSQEGVTQDSVLPGVAPSDSAPPAPVAPKKRRWRLYGAALILPAALLYYGIGGFMLTKIDDSLSFTPSAADLPAKGSRTVAMVSALMDREVNRHGWKPNNPWFYPSAFMDNMPNYQIGILTTCRSVALELKDHIGRLRGAGGTDVDLEKAYADLSFPPNNWFFSIHPPFIGASSSGFYKDSIKGFRKYNARVASGQAVYEKRADTLRATLDRLALSLGNASSKLDLQVDEGSKKLIDFQSDDIFYDARGQAYASYQILNALRGDYGDLIVNRQLSKLWDDMMEDLKAMVEIDPLYVTNAKPGGLISNDLVAQNAKLGLVRSRLREITQILEQ
jgi:hypothetical protein